MRITLNPCSNAPLPDTLVCTSMSDWRFVFEVLHPETGEPVVEAGETVTPWQFNNLQIVGCDSITIERIPALPMQDHMGTDDMSQR